MPNITVVDFTRNPHLGNSFFIECIYDGTPLPSVIWTKNRTELNEAEDNNIQIISSHQSSRIEISEANTDSGGEYTCTASNIAGSNSASHLIILQRQGYYACTLSLHMYKPKGVSGL